MTHNKIIYERVFSAQNIFNAKIKIWAASYNTISYRPYDSPYGQYGVYEMPISGDFCSVDHNGF